jgi:hypothetical protein
MELASNFVTHSVDVPNHILKKTSIENHYVC